MVNVAKSLSTFSAIFIYRKAAQSAPLPLTSTDFQNAFVCAKHDVAKHIDDGFVQSVVSARHTTWTNGWELPIESCLKSNLAAPGQNGRCYARVFDLLNWSRLQNLLPQWIPVDKICHKGMEVLFGFKTNITGKLPEKPNIHITDDTWDTLWTTCYKQLNAQSRISSSCIDIPAVVVVNPDPPRKVNNPCQYEFRMIDGAHRLCLRKYLLILYEGEILDYQSQLSLMDTKEDSQEKTQIQSQIVELQMKTEQARQAPFFILNQTTFESMITDVDPHKTWAKDERIMMKNITTDLTSDWIHWMERVMTYVECGEPKTASNGAHNPVERCREHSEL